MIVQTDAVLQAWLARAIATGGPYDPAALFLGVATAVNNQGAATVIGDVTEATGAMATRQAIASWGTPYKMNDGRWVADAPAKVFKPADASEAQTIAAYFLASAITAGTLKAFDLIGPYPLPDGNAAVTIAVRLTIDPLGRFSVSQVWNG